VRYLPTFILSLTSIEFPWIEVAAREAQRRPRRTTRAEEDDMKIRIRQRRLAFSEAFSVRGIPSRRLRLGVVVSLVAVMSFANAERVLAGVEDPSPTIRVRVKN
jgi:hypothetical protein